MLEALKQKVYEANMELPRRGSSVLLTVKDADKPEILPIARSMADLGMTLYATGGTHRFLTGHGIACRRVNRIAEGAPTILDWIEDGRFDFIINTPGHDHSHNRDGFLIRRAAVERSIPAVTAMDTARAVIQARIMGHEKQLRPVDVAGITGRKTRAPEML